MFQIRLDTYEKNGEWHIVDTAVTRNEFAFACCPDQKFSNIIFSIYIRRRHTFYIMNVILPGIMTSAVLLSIFFCTPSQKVHIGVAALLSFRLFLLNVADTIPRTSDHVPLLGIYLTCTMAITTLAMVATVFVLNLYGMKDKPVPAWARKVFVVYVAKFLCMCDCVPKPHPVTEEDAQHTGYANYGATNLYNTHGGGSMTTSFSNPWVKIDTTKTNKKAQYKLITTKDKNHILQEETDTDDRVTDGEDNVTYHIEARTASPLHRGTPASSTRPPKKKDYSEDWVHVAAVCDRLFFWLCFLFIVVTTMLLFHPLTTSRYFKIPMIEDQQKQ